MKQKITKCPGAKYQPLKLDLATRIAQQRAAQSQPPLVSLASTVPSHRKDGG